MWVSSLRPVCERSTSLYWLEGVVQPRPRAGTGPFAAIFCPTKQPSQEGNQPGLHCRFVLGSGQWLLTDFSLARMEMSVCVWFFICCRNEWGLLIRKYQADEALKKYNLTFRPRPGLALQCMTKSRPPQHLPARVAPDLQWKYIQGAQCSWVG